MFQSIMNSTGGMSSDKPKT